MTDASPSSCLWHLLKIRQDRYLNDANVAEALARVVRLDPKLLYPITHRTQQQQEDLSVIRVRAQLVKARTLLVNTARVQ